MTVYIDADACPVARVAELIAKRHGIPVRLLCDTNHVLTSNYSTVKVIGAGADAVDIALINLCRHGDVVITQDDGVAALALGFVLLLEREGKTKRGDRPRVSFRSMHDYNP